MDIMYKQKARSMHDSGVSTLKSENTALHRLGREVEVDYLIFTSGP